MSLDWDGPVRAGPSRPLGHSSALGEKVCCLRGGEPMESIGPTRCRDKKVTSSVVNESARSLVLEELKMLRRRGGAVTVEAMGLAPTICALLGAGDPRLAFTRLQHQIMSGAGERSITAAAISLGFLSEGATHLARLTDGEGLLHVNQRQVRRYSDEGLAALAAVIATNGTVEAVPELVLDLVQEQVGIALAVSAQWPSIVEMQEPIVELLCAQQRTSVATVWIRSAIGERELTRTETAIRVPRDDRETSITARWPGEMWPKFTVRLHGGASPRATETIGNRVMMRLWEAGQ